MNRRRHSSAQFQSSSHVGGKSLNSVLHPFKYNTQVYMMRGTVVDVAEFSDGGNSNQSRNAIVVRPLYVSGLT